MRYRLIAIDLDGTLLDPEGAVSRANREAILRARAAGCLVVPCTGRGWREAHWAIADVQGLSVGVFVSGAMTCELSGGRTLHRASMDPDLAGRLIERFADCPDAVLVFRDFNEVGHDYLVTGRGGLSANAKWWFELTGALVHEASRVDPADLGATVRVGLATGGDHARRYVAEVRGAMPGLVDIHEMVAVQNRNPEQEIRVVEAFAAGVSKWSAVARLATERGIDPGEIAVIGDEINDLPMIVSAREAGGCSVAMGNAADSVREAAERITRANDGDGVAHAIGQMLAGRW